MDEEARDASTDGGCAAPCVFLWIERERGRELPLQVLPPPLVVSPSVLFPKRPPAHDCPTPHSITPPRNWCTHLSTTRISRAHFVEAPGGPRVVLPLRDPRNEKKNLCRFLSFRSSNSSGPTRARAQRGNLSHTVERLSSKLSAPTHQLAVYPEQARRSHRGGKRERETAPAAAARQSTPANRARLPLSQGCSLEEGKTNS